MNRRIYYVTTVDVGDFSAQSLQIMAMCNAFSKVSKLEFKLYAFSSSEKDIGATFPIKLLKSKKSKLIRTIRILISVLLGKGFKYSIFTRDLYLALFFVLIGKKVVWEAHQETTKGAKRLLQFLNLFSSFRVLTISDALKNSNEITIDNRKIYSYHDGVTLSNYHDHGTKTISFPNEKTALYTGALHKGADIESLEPLFSNFEDWDFLFVGGRLEDIEYYHNLFGIYDNVTFIGRLPHDEIMEYQKSASILLYPLTCSNKLWRYTSPLKLFEYMSSGRPILGSNIGSVSEVIDESNAFVFKGNEGVVAAFESYLRSPPSILSKHQKVNIELIENKFNWDKRIDFILTEVFNFKC